MKKWAGRIYSAGLVLLLLTGVDVAWSATQTDDALEAMKKELAEIKQVQHAMQGELQAIKNLLQAKASPPAAPAKDVTVGLDDDPVKGERGAPLTLIEFSDYQCPFCARHFRETMPQIEAEYIKTGKVKYVFRDFPLDFHKEAFKAAQAAQCAGEQGKYWEMHDRFFANQRALSLADFAADAKALNLDVPAFSACLDGGKYAEEVRKDLAEGKAAGVNGTPAFFLGVAEGNQIKSARFLSGAQPYANFKAAFDALLSPPASPSPQK